ncbi:hypothetical protein DFJ77DRAFT_454620 [Powellomyces hirtus]|nr:hypothetical protein DFJ77DRAFT_454620 [Powellomyces hirtus]
MAASVAAYPAQTIINECPFANNSKHITVNSSPTTYSAQAHGICPLSSSANQGHIDCQSVGNLHLTPADHALSAALQNLTAIDPNYRTAPLSTSFNWSQVAASLPADISGKWYIVVFRSVRRADANSRTLYDADGAAHEEAKNSGGILTYWYGRLEPSDNTCLAMCVWANRDFAKQATQLPSHAIAMRLAARMYVSYTLERYWLIKEKGEDTFRIEQIYK